MIWVDHLEGRYRLTAGLWLDNYLDSGQTPVADTWQHLAVTFDGSLARFYVDGTEVASRTVSADSAGSNTWRVGAYDCDADRVLRRRDRRDPHLLARAQRGRDRGRPRRGARRPRHDAADGARDADRDRRVRAGEPHLGSSHRRGRGRSLQRAPLDDRRVHARRGEPHRAADRHELRRLAAPDRHVLLPGDRAGRGGQRRPGVEPGDARRSPGTRRRRRSRSRARRPEPWAGRSPSPRMRPTTSPSRASSSSATGRTSARRTRRAPYSVAWDTRGELNGTHVLTAVARDGVGNTATSSPVTVTVSQRRRLHGRPPGGVRPRRRLWDDRCRLVGQPQDGDARGRRGWSTSGTLRRRGHAERHDERGRPARARHLLQDRLHARGMGAQAVDEARRRRGRRVGRRSGRRRDDLGRPRRGSVPAHARTNFANYVDSGRTPTVGQWQHVAATYDGTTARFYVDGVETASAPYVRERR